MKYLGVPITTSRLTKMECRGLVEKILAKVHIWVTRSISFAARAQLINTVIFWMFNYWASIFMLTNEVLENITKIYMSYLWGEVLPLVGPPASLDSTSVGQKHMGLGLKDFKLWNKATIAKLVWAISMNKDTLWVRWVYGRYIKEQTWCDYNPKLSYSWYWKKVCQIKVDMKQANSNQQLL